ncbi:MAG: ribulose-phosphate 3-epimerase, partial [Longimicrobiales bacterium]|nr:ribulose-phosphate 3-epimerase [Longimicrobiales bacterium]
GHDAQEAEKAGVDVIQIDVMDGVFVPNITFGPGVVKALRPRVSLPLDVHLMIEHPDRYLDAFARAGADVLTVHQEACPHLHRTVQAIRELGVRAGVALNPATPAEALGEILPDLDLVLVMTVNPGFGGQAFIPGTLAKARRLRRMLDDAGASARLEVDGGVTPANAREVADAGVDVLVAGSAVFGHPGGAGEGVRALRGALAGPDARG